VDWDTQPPLVLAPVATILANHVVRESTLSPNGFALCLHRGCCLCNSAGSWPRLLVNSIYASAARGNNLLCVRRNWTARLSDWTTSPAHNVHTFRAFCCLLPVPDSDNIAWGYLLLPSLHVIEYSNSTIFLFPPPHLLCHLPVSFFDNSIIIVIVVSVWTVVFMWQVGAAKLYQKTWLDEYGLQRGHRQPSPHEQGRAARLWTKQPGLTNVVFSGATGSLPQPDTNSHISLISSIPWPETSKWFCYEAGSTGSCSLSRLVVETQKTC